MHLKAALLKIDYSKPNATRAIQKLCTQYAGYAEPLAELLGDDAQNAATTLNKMLDEVEPLLADLMALRVNHEVMYHLTMEKVSRATHTSAQENNLSDKKRTAIAVDYKNYQQRIFNLLTNPTVSSGDGTMYGMAPLCFAIAAATGRRPIEVLIQGEFRIIDTHRFGFSGQAKKRDNSADEERVIYSLVDTAVVNEAIQSLRKLGTVAELTEMLPDPGEHRTYNMLINTRVANPLNRYAKDFFNDKERVFKDVRSIYARICYEIWFDLDPRWEKSDEDVFFAELLGHENEKAQKHYKSFKVRGLDKNFKPTASGRECRLDKLKKLDGEMPALANGDAAVSIHQQIKALIEKDPDLKITQSLIIKTTGAYRATIQRYMELCADALGIEKRENGRWYQTDEAEPPVLVEIMVDADSGDEIDDEIDDENETPAAAAPIKSYRAKTTRSAAINKAKKPNIRAVKIDGRWHAEIKVDGRTVATADDAGGQQAAIKKAWRRYQDDSATLQISGGKKKGSCRVEVWALGERIIELEEIGTCDSVERAAWTLFLNRA